MAKRIARDNFHAKVKRTLGGRVGYKCSNPNCQNETSGPAGVDGVNNTGIAAHITAASVGGPRYNPDLTNIQRRAFDNGIWLCVNCATTIDNDEGLYTVELLRSWKVLAEKKAQEDNGKRLPSKLDIDNTIKSALFGLPFKMLPTAVSNIHQASSQVLQEMDPRFTVKSSYIDGVTNYLIEPSENVNFSIHIQGDKAKEYKQAFKVLMEEGKDINIDLGSMSIKGSDLLEHIHKEAKGNGSFNISRPKTKAKQKLWLVNRETNQVESFDDINGEITAGTKAITFNGGACDGLLEFELKLVNPDVTNHINIVMTLKYEKWQGMSLQSLPFFEKLRSLFSKLCDGWDVYTSLEINGERAFSSNGLDMSGFERTQIIRTILDYTKFCKIISSKLNADIKFDSDIKFTEEEFIGLYDVSEVIQGNWVFTEPTELRNASSRLTIIGNPPDTTFLRNNSKPAQIVMQYEPYEAKLFKTSITLPSLSITLDSVVPKVLSTLDGLKAGDTVDVEWIPQENFKCTYEYLF